MFESGSSVITWSFEIYILSGANCVDGKMKMNSRCTAWKEQLGVHCANKGLFGPLKHASNQAFNGTIF